MSSDSLRPCGLQHVRLCCPSPSPGVCLSSCPLSRWCCLTISSPASPVSSWPQSFPASDSLPMSLLFILINRAGRKGSPHCQFLFCYLNPQPNACFCDGMLVMWCLSCHGLDEPFAASSTSSPAVCAPLFISALCNLGFLLAEREKWSLESLFQESSFYPWGQWCPQTIKFCDIHMQSPSLEEQYPRTQILMDTLLQQAVFNFPGGNWFFSSWMQNLTSRNCRIRNTVFTHSLAW